MSIIYVLIARGQCVLTEFTESSGNFPLISLQVLKACDNRKYVKYASSGYMYYILNAECTYMVLCEQSYSERIAFNFLETIRKSFIGSYNEQKIENAVSKEMMSFATILRKQVGLYNSPEQVDKVARLLKETEEVSKIIEEDLEKILRRGEKITVLVQKTETMNVLSLEMKHSSRTIRNEMMFQNWKMRIILGLVIAGVIYFILVLGCGGFLLGGCF